MKDRDPGPFQRQFVAFSVLDPRRWFRPQGRRSAPIGPSFVPVVEVLEDRTALTTFTLSSPIGKLPAFVSRVGGIVLDMVGENGQRIVRQLPPDALFLGMFDSGDPVEFQGNPGTIGVQTGFTPALQQALGGGLSELAVRITLFDGDTGTGDFDRGENRLLLNGVEIGDFSDVFTQETSPNGRTALSNNPDGGFRNDRLDTGFFHTQDPAVLDAFFATLSSGKAAFELSDVDPFENFFDFTQGLAPGTVGGGPPDRGAEPAPEAPVPVPLLPPPGSPDVAPLLIALLAGGPVAAPPSAPPVPAAVPATSGEAVSTSAAIAAVRPGALLPGSQATDAVEAAIQTASPAAVGPSLTRAATAAARALATAGDAAVRAVTGAIDQALAVLEDGLALVRAARAAARAAEPIIPAALGPAPGDVEVSAPPPAVTQPQPAAPVTQTIVTLLSALVVFRRGSPARTRSGLRRHRSKAPGANGDRPRDGPGGTTAPRP